MERLLRAGEARYRAIMENAAEAIIIANEQGAIEEFNRSAEDMFGYLAEEIIGRELAVLMPASEGERHRHALRRYVETGKPSSARPLVERTARRADGTLFPVEASVDEVHVGDRILFAGSSATSPNAKKPSRRCWTPPNFNGSLSTRSPSRFTCAIWRAGSSTAIPPSAG
ncbi:MAG: PAS domain S-box protein [Deltaproteobacteria bacterium]|nr:PAS domain S-box protein [Deltaproteobacteria bacterium]